MSASVTAAASARATKRPRTLAGGCSRTPWASIRGSSSSRRSVGELRVARRRARASCSATQRLVCLAWKVSCSATPRQRSTARRSSVAALELRAWGEQLVGVEVDRARVDLDVPGVGEPGSDQRPHRVQPLQHQGEAVGEVLVERVEPAALRGGAVQLLDERRRAHHAVTARG